MELEWRVQPLNGGWVAVEQRDGTGETRKAWVRAAPNDGGRLRIVDFLLTDDEGISARSLLTFRLGELEQIINTYEYDRIVQRLGVPSVDLRDAMKEAGTTRGTRRRPPSSPPPRARLEKPQAKRYGPGFYKQVAAAYREAVAERKAPLVAIAAEADVPHSTAARWVREAKRLGLLV